jgi:hypothetical protein
MLNLSNVRLWEQDPLLSLAATGSLVGPLVGGFLVRTPGYLTFSHCPRAHPGQARWFKVGGAGRRQGTERIAGEVQAPFRKTV